MSCDSATRKLLTFWLAGSLSPAEAALVAAHVETCAECREAAIAGYALVKGFRELHLRADEIVAAAAGALHAPHLLVCSQCRDEVALLRDLNADLATPSVRIDRTRQLRLALTAAAVIIIAVPVVWRLARPAQESATASTAAAPQPAAPVSIPQPRISVEKASLAALANEAVMLRGSPSPRRALLDDLAVALEPYRRDDFDEALTRLMALQPRHPDAVEIAYYRGVCLLLLNRPAEALTALQASVPENVTGEAAFYLAVARVNAAQTKTESDAGVTDLTRLCNGGSEVAARACAVLPSSDARPR